MTLREQPDLFSQPSEGYSHLTSKPAYESNKIGKNKQALKMLSLVKELKETCLLELAEKMNIPQSTVSGRCKDLRKAGLIRYTSKEDYIMYKGYLRKKIVLT